ncbi:MAG: aspartate carbamoyltransferase [SAR324 cluster bacterium]|nr:aspartate carbamoyltransferase [SAR324 cluster bacterium]MCZ6645852.1 aspartate carbamoyltransferase [SAR324 cluster bacterium]MCZ6729767.1 aspartate carbamoyltransferase [SAR324 cluster bacterium]MCZ6841870.1 aspartate carbamoyltransferase [SAR324 cluster bacterium]
MGTVRHIIESQQFDREYLSTLFERAHAFSEQGKSRELAGFTMASLFYEPSTRTRFSFEAAMYRLGGNVITTENAREFSSLAKGESLEDTIRIISGYVDLIVMRHNEIGAAKRAAEISPVPIINGGDGAGQHPTQALLDLYTLFRKFNRLDGLRVAMVGDLRYGRTVRSLAYLLSKYDNVELIFVAPPVCQMHEDIKDFLSGKSVNWREESDLDAVLPHIDSVYMTRIQKERFHDQQEFKQANNAYRLTRENVSKMAQEAIILHPLPRVGEIDPAVDNDHRAMYFEQARNGLWIRMALIQQLLTGDRN